MFLLLNDLMQFGGRGSMPRPRPSLFLHACGKASYACGGDMRNMLPCQSVFKRSMLPGSAC
jgi:hypothetical protein